MIKRKDANEIHRPKKSRNILIGPTGSSKKFLAKGQGKVNANRDVSDVNNRKVLQLMNTRFEKIEAALENISTRINTSNTM